MVGTSVQPVVTGVREYFDAAAEGWDAHSHADPALLRRIVAAAGLPPGARVLDVACGTGVMFAPLLEAAPALLRAIDLAPRMVEQARQRYPGQPGLVVSCADFYGFAETGFDLVMVYNAYPHFADKAAFARQLAACLAPGGCFIIAHGAGRQRINACHAGRRVRPVSTPLLPAAQEARRLAPALCCDAMTDREDLYLLLGHAAP